MAAGDGLELSFQERLNHGQCLPAIDLSTLLVGKRKQGKRKEFRRFTRSPLVPRGERVTRGQAGVFKPKSGLPASPTNRRYTAVARRPWRAGSGGRPATSRPATPGARRRSASATVSGGSPVRHFAGEPFARRAWRGRRFGV